MAAQIENILCAGTEKAEGVKILLSLTDMTSENMEGALIDHLVTGHPATVSCALNGVTKSNFSRDLKTLNKVANKLDKYFELYYTKSVNR